MKNADSGCEPIVQNPLINWVKANSVIPQHIKDYI